MEKYKINILPIAIQDIINIKTSILNEYNDIYNANKIITSIFNEINTLSTFPKRTQIRLKVSELDLRFLKIGKYTIIYWVDDIDNTIKVYGVFHSHRNIFEIIKGRV